MRSSAEVAPVLPLSVPSSVAVRRVAFGGMLLVCAVILGVMETWLVALSPLPWLRLGLANIAVVVALAWLGPRTALTVSGLRVVLVGLATGTLFGPSTVLAAAGAVFAFCAMLAVRALGEGFSVVGWSIAGAFAHVVGQFAAAVIVTGTLAVVVLAPISVLVSLLLGLATGLVALSLISRVVTPVR